MGSPLPLAVGVSMSDTDVTVLRADPEGGSERGSGVRTSHLVTRGVGARAFLNGITTFAPGAVLPYHWHDCEESVLVLEGYAVCETPAGARRLAVRDVTWIPAGVVHRFRNASRREVMRIFWTYGSAEASRTIAETGETTRVEGEAEPGAMQPDEPDWDRVALE